MRRKQAAPDRMIVTESGPAKQDFDGAPGPQMTHTTFRGDSLSSSRVWFFFEKQSSPICGTSVAEIQKTCALRER